MAPRRRVQKGEAISEAAELRDKDKIEGGDEEEEELGTEGALVRNPVTIIDGVEVNVEDNRVEAARRIAHGQTTTQLLRPLPDLRLQRRMVMRRIIYSSSRKPMRKGSRDLKGRKGRRAMGRRWSYASYVRIPLTTRLFRLATTAHAISAR